MDTRQQKELKKLGLHIRSLRVKQELTQETLADKANLSPSQIGRLERGILNPSYLTLLAIAEALSIPVERLVQVD